MSESTAEGQDSTDRATGEDRICLKDAHTGRWLAFSRPHKVISTCKLAEVTDCLREVEHLVTSRGWAAAGFLAFDAAPAFDAALTVRADSSFPLLWFGLFPPPCPVDLPEPLSPLPDLPWNPTVDEAEYRDCIQRIQHYIADNPIRWEFDPENPDAKTPNKECLTEKRATSRSPLP